MPFATLNHMEGSDHPLHLVLVFILIIYTGLYLEVVSAILYLFGLYMNQGGIPFLFAIIFTVFVTLPPFFHSIVGFRNFIDLIQNARS